MSTAAPSPPTRPSGARVDAILQAACRVVVREGAHGLRMATVAAEAGVSKALVHYYFATRQELLRSAFAYADRHLSAALDAELDGLGTGRERIERALLAGVEPGPPFAEQRALWNQVWSGLADDDDLRPFVVQCYRAWIDRLTGLISAGQADASISAAVDPTTAATRLAALGDGLDSMLYLGLVDHATAGALAAAALERELAG